MRRVVAAVVVAQSFAFATVALAHHSYAEFLDETVSMQATLEKATFANPHTILTLRSSDSTIYTATWNAGFQLHSMGVEPTDLKAGDVLLITGYPSRDPNAHQLAKLREVRRISDGWTWRMKDGHATVSRPSKQPHDGSPR